jgi:hypothetical protein
MPSMNGMTTTPICVHVQLGGMPEFLLAGEMLRRRLVVSASLIILLRA